MNPPCLRCGHDYERHITDGYAGGSYYCREKECACRVYVKRVSVNREDS